MDRSKIGRFIDNSVITFISIIIFFTIFKTFIINNFICLILSLIISFIILKILIGYQNKRYTKLKIKKDEIKQIEACNFELRKMSTLKQMAFFKKLFSQLSPTITKNFIVIDNKIAISLCLFKDQIEKEDIFSAYSKLQQLKLNYVKEVVLICNYIPTEIIPFLQKFDDIVFTLFSPIETYGLMKKFNYFPSIKEEKSTKKKHTMIVIKQAFVRKHAKNFIRCGIVLYIAGIFVPFTKYYIITASICLILGAVCLCFGSKETTINPLSRELLN